MIRLQQSFRYQCDGAHPEPVFSPERLSMVEASESAKRGRWSLAAGRHLCPECKVTRAEAAQITQGAA